MTPEEALNHAATTRLISDIGFSEELAVAYVQAGGRCEYCGTDLLMNRQGYASAELDHLLPRSQFPELSSDLVNLVLCCRTCNGVKGNWSDFQESEAGKKSLKDNRRELIAQAREHISKKMIEYNNEWRKATRILHEVWWKSEKNDT